MLLSHVGLEECVDPDCRENNVTVSPRAKALELRPLQLLTLGLPPSLALALLLPCLLMVSH